MNNWVRSQKFLSDWWWRWIVMQLTENVSWSITEIFWHHNWALIFLLLFIFESDLFQHLAFKCNRLVGYEAYNWLLSFNQWRKENRRMNPSICSTEWEFVWLCEFNWFGESSMDHCFRPNTKWKGNRQLSDVLKGKRWI